MPRSSSTGPVLTSNVTEPEIPLREDLLQTIESPGRRLRLLFFCFLGLFTIAAIFVSLRQSLQTWDESRVINNALELVSSKTWIVTTYNGMPDHWYSKPPLYPWIVSALLRLRIDPMVALRLPSLAAAVLSVLLIYFFSAKLLRRPFAGVVGALLLMCSTMFFGPHVGLTGDLDALLSLLDVLYALAFWAFLERAGGRETVWLVLSCASLSLAVMTKGIAGAMFLPGLLVFVLLRPQRLKVLSDWRLWTGLLLASVVPLSYYAYRNRLDPGYVQAVINNELLRFGTTIEGHQGGPLFYVIRLIKDFEPGLLFVALGCFALRKDVAKDERSRSAAMMCGVVALVFILALTKSKTKAIYYYVPALPLLSLFGALGLVDTGALVLARMGAGTLIGARWFRVGVPVFLGVIAAGGMAVRAKHVEAHRRGSETDGYRREFRNFAQQNTPSRRVFLLEEPHADETNDLHYFPVGEFWAKTLAKKQGIDVGFASKAEEVPEGGWVISCDPALYSVVEKEGRVDRVVDTWGHCLLELTKVRR